MASSEKKRLWYYFTDGTVKTSRRGNRVELLAVDLPWTLVTEAAAPTLLRLRDLRHLSLSGRHFATRRADAKDLAVIAASGGTVKITLNGAILHASTLHSLLAQTSDLETIDVRGLAADLSVLEAIVRASPHLRSLSIGWAKGDGEHAFPPVDLGAQAITTIAPLKNLHRLAVRGLTINDSDLVEQNHLAHLREVDISHTRISSVGLGHLARHGLLRSLDVEGCPITDSCAPVLEANKDLAHLSLASTKVSDIVTQAFVGLHRLSSLNLAFTRITGAGLIHFAGLPNLRTLVVSNTLISGPAISKFVNETPSLRKLKAGTTTFSPTDLAALQALEEIELGANPDPNEFAALAKLDGRIDLTASDFPQGKTSVPNGLRSLRLTAPLRDEILASIAPLPALEDLVIRKGGAHLAAMSSDGISGLRNLFAQASGLNDAALLRLALRPGIEALYISANPISTRGLVSLQGAPHLHTLELRDVPLDAAVMDTLLTLPSLHCLDLPGTGLPPGVVARLADAPSLQSLALDSDQLSEEVVTALANLQTLMEIYLYGEEFAVEQLKLLKRLPHLTEVVYMSKAASLGVEAVPVLADLAHLRHLKGAIDNEARVALAQARPDIYINGVSGSQPSTLSPRMFRAEYLVEHF